MSQTTNLSSRRMSLEKAQSRKTLDSQKALNSQQTLEGNGIADGHQKPTGTAVNTLADVETGQMHHNSTTNGHGTLQPRSNSGGHTVLPDCMSAFMQPATYVRCVQSSASANKHLGMAVVF